jgi:hypothetical protein
LSIIMISIVQINTLKNGLPCLVIADAQDEGFVTHTKGLRDACKDIVDDIFQTWIGEISISTDGAVDRTLSKLEPIPHIKVELFLTHLDNQQDGSNTGLKGTIKLTLALSPGIAVPPPTMVQWTCYISDNPKSVLAPELQYQLLKAQRSELLDSGTPVDKTLGLGFDDSIAGEPSSSGPSGSNLLNGHDRSSVLTRSASQSALEGPESATEHSAEVGPAGTGDTGSTGGSSRWPSLLAKIVPRKGMGKGKARRP